MALILAYWIAVAAVGFGPAVSALWRSCRVQQYLWAANAATLPAPRGALLATNRYEILRDAFLTGALGVNVSLALWTAHVGLDAVAVRVVLLLVGAPLLSAFAIANYWLRYR